MNISAQIISELLQFYLWDNPSVLERGKIESLTTEQWLEVHQLSLRQGVCAMILDALIAAQISIPRPLKMRFISSTDKVEKRYQSKINAAKKLKKIYSENDIKLMILKGIGLAQLYPVANHRPCSDIDIWLFGKQEEADEILSSQYNISVDEAHHHHTVFHIDGVMVENHYDFIEQHSRSSQALVERYLKELSADEELYTINIDGTDFYIPSPNLNALFLIMHSGSHFAAENISVRHLIDWMQFLRHYGDKVDWGRLLNFSDTFGFRPFLECLNSMCINYLGMPEKMACCTMKDEKIVKKAIEDVLKYKQKNIPNNFIKGWIFRFKRRFSNSWKQKMVYKDNQFFAFFRSFLTHIIHPKIWKK
ncbi:MAG: hypothetical protein E7143_07690 [Rikenellaceae bacterium]|nr:hypothetical protein [Rikenellaceae bacterium]